MQWVPVPPGSRTHIINGPQSAMKSDRREQMELDFGYVTQEYICSMNTLNIDVPGPCPQALTPGRARMQSVHMSCSQECKTRVEFIHIKNHTHTAILFSSTVIEGSSEEKC